MIMNNMPNNKPQNILDKFTYHFKKVLINAQNLAFAKKRKFIEPADLLASLVNIKGSLGSDILIKQKIRINLLVFSLWILISLRILMIYMGMIMEIKF